MAWACSKANTSSEPDRLILNPIHQMQELNT